MDVKKDTRDIIVVIGAALVVVSVMFGGLFMYSGHWPSFSVVESGSMQHGERSTLHTIDTGDMVVIRDPSKVEIQSYVDGHHSGYVKFGEYGDVIVYERLNSGNPIIHRAILWLEWDTANETWSAPSLQNYRNADGWLWDCTGSTDHDWNDLSGILTLHDIGYSEKSPEIDLDTLVRESGYLTMGDNGVTNQGFDQAAYTGFSARTLVSEDRIIYVAGFEIPWIGTIKLILTDSNKSPIPPNSIPDMIAVTAVAICFIVMLFVAIDYVEWRRKRE